ncbi:MAG: hypothetical protein V5A61_16435 [Haloarculaceae archaeon]
MQTKQMLLSEHVRRRVQLGIVPVVVGSITSMGAPGLVELVGIGSALGLVGLLIAVQAYLILARVWVDLLGGSG